MVSRAVIGGGLAILVALSVALAPGALADLHHAQGPGSHVGTNGMPPSPAGCGCLALRDLGANAAGPSGSTPSVSLAESASKVISLPLVVRLTVPPPERLA